MQINKYYLFIQIIGIPKIKMRMWKLPPYAMSQNDKIMGWRYSYMSSVAYSRNVAVQLILNGPPTPHKLNTAI